MLCVRTDNNSDSSIRQCGDRHIPERAGASNGVLYGTTQAGGSAGYGTVFELQPPTSPGGEWTETVLHNFGAQPGDGIQPESVPLVGPGGELYGTTVHGGAFVNCGSTPPGCGTVFELEPPTTPGGPWTETLLYSFTSLLEANTPLATPVLCTNPSVCDEGALYGTTVAGGSSNGGTVFELRPPATSGAAWTLTTLHDFSGGPQYIPRGGPVGLAMNDKGVLYGVTLIGGKRGAGTVFELTPPAMPGGEWTERTLYAFESRGDGSIPYEPPVIAPDGSLYGSTGGCYNFCAGPFGDAQVFRLKPPTSPGGSWTKRLFAPSNRHGDWSHRWSSGTALSTLPGAASVGASYLSSSGRPMAPGPKRSCTVSAPTSSRPETS